MKINQSKLCLLLVIVVLVLSSCKEDQIGIGELSVKLTNNPGDVVVYILPAENPEVVISAGLQPDNNGELTHELNFGNYILQVSSSNTFYSEVGFQIIAGRTTTIYFDSNNIGTIQ